MDENRIYREFIEMPGLRLTLSQAQRLWGLDAATCARALDALTEQHVLCLGHDGKYGRPVDGLGHRPVPR